MIDERLDNPSGAPQWLARVATTLVAWLVAFLVVTGLLTLFGDELGSLPVAVRGLVISGVLVTLMVNVVMPTFNGAVARRFAGPPRSRLRGARVEADGEPDRARSAM
jgi:antibiotic biosynthesis monooxygenase (ABM) superfamily enzyme